MKKLFILSFALVGMTLAGCAAEETTPADTMIDEPAEVTTEPMIDDTTMMGDDAMMGDEGMMEDEAPADTTM